MNSPAPQPDSVTIVLTCMDYRIQAEQTKSDLGLQGDHVYWLTNAGARATADTLSSIALAELLNPEITAAGRLKVVVMPHTDCGAGKHSRFEIDQLAWDSHIQVGSDFTPVPSHDPAGFAKTQLEILRAGNWDCRLSPQTQFATALWETERGHARWLSPPTPARSGQQL